jgi:hypothetical protein
LGVRDISKNVLGAIGATIDWLYDRLMVIVKTLQYHSGGMSWSEAWNKAGEDVKNARKVMQEEGQGMEDALKKMADATGKSVDEFKAYIAKLGGNLLPNLLGLGQGKGKGTDPLADFKGAMKADLGQLVKDWSNWSNQISGLVTNMVKTTSSALSTGLFDFLTGKMVSFKESFAQFSQSILKMILDIIVQLMVAYAIKQSFTAMGGMWAAMVQHEGGLIAHAGTYIRKAHEGLSQGEVPIIAQKGEGILSRNGMATLGSVENLNKLNAGESAGGGSTVNLTQVIRAWSPEDVYRERKMLASAMIEELSRNGPFRGAIKKYA